MFFTNLTLYSLGDEFRHSAASLAEAIKPCAFVPCGANDVQTMGWSAPRDGGELVYALDEQFLLRLDIEKKLLPAKVIKKEVARRVEIHFQQQGFKPGKKQLRQIKEDAEAELLPRAFTTTSSTLVWIDVKNGWLGIDTASANRSDDVIGLLLKADPALPIRSINTAQDTITAMTQWLAQDFAPVGFTVDQDALLCASGESTARVRYADHTLEPADMGGHIEAGKSCHSLGMTWDSKISFVLTKDSITLKKIKQLDVMAAVVNEDEQFDSDFTLLAGELHALSTDLVDALGGLRSEE